MSTQTVCSCGVVLQRAATNGSKTYVVSPGACRHCRTVARVRSRTATTNRYRSFAVLKQVGGAFAVVALLCTASWWLMLG